MTAASPRRNQLGSEDMATRYGIFGARKSTRAAEAAYPPVTGAAGISPVVDFVDAVPRPGCDYDEASSAISATWSELSDSGSARSIPRMLSARSSRS